MHQYIQQGASNRAWGKSMGFLQCQLGFFLYTALHRWVHSRFIIRLVANYILKKWVILKTYKNALNKIELINTHVIRF
jgi:hypothetical protein